MNPAKWVYFTCAIALFGGCGGAMPTGSGPSGKADHQHRSSAEVGSLSTRSPLRECFSGRVHQHVYDVHEANPLFEVIITGEEMLPHAKLAAEYWSRQERNGWSGSVAEKPLPSGGSQVAARVLWEGGTDTERPKLTISSLEAASHPSDSDTPVPLPPALSCYTVEIRAVAEQQLPTEKLMASAAGAKVTVARSLSSGSSLESRSAATRFCPVPIGSATHRRPALGYSPTATPSASGR